MLLAGWQGVLGIAPQSPSIPLVDPIRGPLQGIFDHDAVGDGIDQRFIVLLRLPNVLLGAITILLTAATARALSRDPWTPVVAAAIVATVPKFVFLSGVVNNDNLANTFAAAVTLLSVLVIARGTLGRRHAILLGALLGVCVLTKLTTLALVPGAAFAIVASRDDRGRWSDLVVVATVAAMVAGPWLGWNTILYGDPFAIKASTAHLGDLFPALLDVGPPLQQALLNVPTVLWTSYWYSSGWNQFSWPFWSYVPFWLIATVGVASACLALSQLHGWQRRQVQTLALFVFYAFAAVWVVGHSTTTTQGRIAFIGLPAMACLTAFGLEKLRLPVWVRGLLPALGAAGVLVALRIHAIGIYV